VRAADTCTIESGLYDGATLGSTIMVRVPNKDQRSNDYSEMALAYRRAADPRRDLTETETEQDTVAGACACHVITAGCVMW